VKYNEENGTPLPPSHRETISQTTLLPIIESNYKPGFEELERDARKFHRCYSDGRGPQLTIGLSPSNSEHTYYLKEIVIGTAHSLATLQLENII